MTTRSVAQYFAGKHVLVTGGTGSFGQHIVRELSQYDVATIRVLSRDEKKQYDMLHAFSDVKPLQCMLGDVRDFGRVQEAVDGMDVVFHAAALKQVPNCEFAPYEAVRTNVEGAENVRRASIAGRVQSVVAVSTDKAVKPVNVMGISKALQERIMLQAAALTSGTKFTCVRYGNVLGSRGSVVPFFKHLIAHRKPLPITHPGMTRFQLTLSEAVGLVLEAAVRGETGELWVRKMPSARIVDLAAALAKGMTGDDHYPTEIVGTRPGEKMHEVLVSEEEMWRARELDNYYVIPPWQKSGDATVPPDKKQFDEYSSGNTRLLAQAELIAMLEKDGWLAPLEPHNPKVWEV